MCNNPQYFGDFIPMLAGMHFLLNIIDDLLLPTGRVKFEVFANSSLPIEQHDKLLHKIRIFILACYNMSNCTSLNVSRVKVWQNKMKRNGL